MSDNTYPVGRVEGFESGGRRRVRRYSGEPLSRTWRAVSTRLLKRFLAKTRLMWFSTVRTLVES
jgi:hypothetical protein